MLSKNANNKRCAHDWKKRERFQLFLTRKINFECQILALFDISPLTQFSKFNTFFCVCWFLDKNLSNFVFPAWKLDNPYCHNVCTTSLKSGVFTRYIFSYLSWWHLRHEDRGRTCLNFNHDAQGCLFFPVYTVGYFAMSCLIVVCITLSFSCVFIKELQESTYIIICWWD